MNKFDRIMNNINKYLLTKKDRTLKKRYARVIYWLTYHENDLVRPFVRKKNRSLRDETPDFIVMVNALEIGIIYGNDAPKGGCEGDYFKISRKGLLQLDYIKKNFPKLFNYEF